MAGAGGWKYGSVEDLVRLHGRWYAPASGELVPAVGFSGVASAAKERRAQYVEGYLLDAAHRVQAAAWGARGGEVVIGEAGLAYLGVPLVERFRRLVCRRSGAASALHGQQLDRWRLLRAGVPSDAMPWS